MTEQEIREDERRRCKAVLCKKCREGLQPIRVAGDIFGWWHEIRPGMVVPCLAGRIWEVEGGSGVPVVMEGGGRTEPRTGAEKAVGLMTRDAMREGRIVP